MTLNKLAKYDKINVQDETFNSLEDVLSDVVGVKVEPYLSEKRKRARERAVEKGFTDEYHMECWLWFNRLDSEQYSGYDVDILHMTSSGDGFE